MINNIEKYFSERESKNDNICFEPLTHLVLIQLKSCYSDYVPTYEIKEITKKTKNLHGLYFYFMFLGYKSTRWPIESLWIL